MSDDRGLMLDTIATQRKTKAQKRAEAELRQAQEKARDEQREALRNFVRFDVKTEHMRQGPIRERDQYGRLLWLRQDGTRR